MLPPFIRNSVIEALIGREISQMQYDQSVMKGMIRNGFSGYASFSDRDLLGVLKIYAQQDGNCRSALEQVANYVLLGDNG